MLILITLCYNLLQRIYQMSRSTMNVGISKCLLCYRCSMSYDVNDFKDMFIFGTLLGGAISGGCILSIRS